MLPISQITLRKWCFLKFSCKEMFSTTCEWCVQHDMQQTSEHFCLRSITKDFSDKICTRKMYLHYFDLVKTAWHLASCMELFVFQVKFFPPCLYRQVLLMNITVSLQILSHERPIHIYFEGAPDLQKLPSPWCLFVMMDNALMLWREAHRGSGESGFKR